MSSGEEVSRSEMAMADRLLIHDLTAECRVGVFDWEQAAPQPIWIDLELAIDAAKAAAQDDIKRAIDYGQLVTSITRYVQGRSFRLLETLAEEVAALVLKEFQTRTVAVRVKKRALPGVDYAAVEVTRSSAQ
jgi:dihydroneopterin aldolase